MKNTKFKTILALAFLIVAHATHGEPSTPRKIAATITSPFATLGALSLAGFATDVALKNTCAPDSSFVGTVRPWLIGAATAYMAYKIFLPASHCFYTLLADDSQKLIALVGKDENDKGIIHENEETIKEILREILYVKNEIIRIEGDRHRDQNGEYIVLHVLQKDLFVKDLPKIIGDSEIPQSRATANSAVEVLKNTKNLVPKTDKSNSHWWSTSVGKAILWTQSTLVAPFTCMKKYTNKITWSLKKDTRLLTTLGGITIEQAADTLVKTVKKLSEYNSAFPSNNQVLKELNTFYTNAEILIRSAENVLKDLKAQREEIQRIRDIVFLFKKPSSDKHDTIEQINDYSMNILSQIYA